MTRRHHETIVNGVHFHLVEQGEGPLVVMGHGFPGLWYSWRHQLDALAAAGYRAVAFDQRGIGGTEAPADPAAYDHDHTTADLLAIAETFGEEQAVFVGHDFGGPQVWELAVRAPDRVRAIAVLSTPYEPGRPDIPPTESNAAVAREHFLHRHYFQAVGPADEELAGDVEGFLRRLFFALSGDGDYLQVWTHPSEGNGYLDVLPRFDQPLPWLTDDDFAYFVENYERTGFTGGLNWYRAADRNWELKAGRTNFDVEVPALFIAGSCDPVPVMAQAGVLERMAAHVPALHLVEVPGAGHWVQQERPGVVNDALVAFLDALPDA